MAEKKTKKGKLAAAKKAKGKVQKKRQFAVPKGKKVALISVYNKTGIVDFAKGLIDLGWAILSSGGTAGELRKAGLKVTDVADLTGLPPILDHRVVTLHPSIHGGILAKDTPEHDAERKSYGIPRINLVCVDLYPVIEAIATPNATMELVMDKTDIGGPTMIRGAAKNHNNGCVVICDPTDRSRVIAELQETGQISKEFRLELAHKVFSLMARYDAAISKFLASEMGLEVEAIFMTEVKKLAYAENKCQNPAHLFSDGSDDPLAIHRFDVITGDPSYTSTADASGILEILCTLAQAFRLSRGKVPFIAIAGKHGNPCGAAIDWQDPGLALLKALCGDTVAVMGGEVITNFPITGELGQLLFQVPPKMNIGREKWGLDLVMAPDFAPEAVELLNKYEKRRLLSNPHLLDPFLSPNQWTFKPVRGAFLRQKQYPFILTPEGVQEWVNDPLRGHAFENILIAWAIGWKASSNTVALAKDNMLISLGCGQQDRIACVRLCLDRATRAGHDTEGSFFASDAFFPFAESTLDPVKVDAIYKCFAEMKQPCFKGKKIPKNQRTKMTPKEKIREWAKVVQAVLVADQREGDELLIDAGCKGGVVTADGKNLPEVQKLFKEAGLSVAFVAPENRGFAKH